MRVAAVVPFKCFTRAKKRLRSRFSDAQVEAILHALLADVLTALRAARPVDYVGVLTDDSAVAAVAREAGADVRLRTPDPGLNPAIELAGRELAAEGYDALLVALGDLPLLQPADVEALVDAGERHPVVLLAAEDGGTAMLLRRPPDRIPARFGRDSAARHEAAAREAGVELHRVRALHPLTAVDLDTPEDARRVLQAEIPCRTREVLKEFAS